MREDIRALEEQIEESSDDLSSVRINVDNVFEWIQKLQLSYVVFLFFDLSIVAYSSVSVWAPKNTTQYYYGDSQGFDQWWLLAYYTAMTRIIALCMGCFTSCSLCMTRCCAR